MLDLWMLLNLLVLDRLVLDLDLLVLNRLMLHLLMLDLLMLDLMLLMLVLLLDLRLLHRMTLSLRHALGHRKPRIQALLTLLGLRKHILQLLLLLLQLMQANGSRTLLRERHVALVGSRLSTGCSVVMSIHGCR